MGTIFVVVSICKFLAQRELSSSSRRPTAGVGEYKKEGEGEGRGGAEESDS